MVLFELLVYNLNKNITIACIPFQDVVFLIEVNIPRSSMTLSQSKPVSTRSLSFGRV